MCLKYPHWQWQTFGEQRNQDTPGLVGMISEKYTNKSSVSLTAGEGVSLQADQTEVLPGDCKEESPKLQRETEL